MRKIVPLFALLLLLSACAEYDPVPIHGEGRASWTLPDKYSNGEAMTPEEQRRCIFTLYVRSDGSFSENDKPIATSEPGATEMTYPKEGLFTLVSYRFCMRTELDGQMSAFSPAVVHEFAK
jgi:hypothetical protein